jgi:hypothetical protein
MRTGGPLRILLALGAALTLTACGSSASSTTEQAGLSTTTSSTSSTTTTSAKPAKAHKHKAKAKTHKSTSTTTTSKTTTSKKTTSKTTSTTTHTTTSKTKTKTTTAALQPPLVATLVGENHHPKIKTKWSYTITAKDSGGHPLSGTIETDFTYNGTVVGKENPFKHQFTGGTFTNQVTYPADSLGQPIAINVTVITSIGTKTLTWPVKSVK